LTYYFPEFLQAKKLSEKISPECGTVDNAYPVRCVNSLTAISVSIEEEKC